MEMFPMFLLRIIFLVPAFGFAKIFFPGWYLLYTICMVVICFLFFKLNKKSSIKLRALIAVGYSQWLIRGSIFLQYLFGRGHIFSGKVGFPIKVFDTPTGTGGSDIPPLDTFPVGMLNFLLCFLIIFVLIYFIPEKYITNKAAKAAIIIGIIGMLYGFGMMTLAFD